MPAVTTEPGASFSDEELMLAFARGSVEAFEELFRRYKQPIYGFFRRRVTDPARAEELTQDTFLAVVRAAARYERDALFRTYLYAIALKILRAHRRKAAFRAVFSGPMEQAKEPATAGSLSADVVLRDALGKLEKTDRELLMLRAFEELSYAEIADLLGVPLNTVRSRLFRTRMALRALLTAAPPGARATTSTGCEERL